jgi:hypothetical protein
VAFPRQSAQSVIRLSESLKHVDALELWALVHQAILEITHLAAPVPGPYLYRFRSLNADILKNCVYLTLTKQSMFVREIECAGIYLNP